MSQPHEPLRDDDPRNLGGWITQARLGTGGMGTVYLAERDEQVAAVKVITPALASDPGFRARFRREVELCGRVSGPNVARVLDADADGPTPWLAMQYIEGPTLHQRVHADSPLPREELDQLAEGLALALQAMHRVGVVHRDLKPSNVILTPNGPRVIDFGVATAAEATTLTAAGTVVGSAGWMAPEQVTGSAVGPPTDVFSWGATIAFAATGRPPFGTGRPEAISYRVVHEPPDLGGFAGPLGELVRRSLQSDPSRRPTVGDLLAAPDEQTTSVAESLPSPEVTRVEPTALSAQVAERTGSNRRSRWLRASLLLGALALAAVAAAGIGAWTRTTGEEVDTSTPDGGSVSTTTGAPSSTSSSTPAQIPVPAAEEVNIVTPGGADPPPLPSSLKGWAPVGPMERTEVRVFDSDAYSVAPGIGPSWNSCSDGFWTARWRSANPDIPLRVAVGSSALVDPTSPEWTDEALPPDSPTGTAGYASGFICLTPQFGWSDDGGTGSTLVDVIIEWQEWEPAV